MLSGISVEQFLLSIPLIVVVIGYFYIWHPSFVPGKSFSLPVIKEKSLIGREEEMKIMLDYLNDTEVNVVTLFGQAGFGKSEIALHIGHKMIEMGVDVYYIKVEEVVNTEDLEQTLMAISEVPFTGLRLMKWAKSLAKRTLLILDNVDGHHWVEKESRRQFQTSFVDELLSYTSDLQVLITSQEAILSKYNFKSHKLHSLFIENCVLLVNTSVDQDPDVSESEALCTLVGNVPMAIKVLTKILSSSYSMTHVIQRLNETISSKKLKFIAESGDRVDKDRIISAIELAFEFIKPEYQVCSLLLIKFPGSFSLDMVTSIVTSDMMEDFGHKDFYINDCLYELSSKSFLEQISFLSLLTHNQVKERFHFHVLIRDFLNTSTARDKHNVTELIENFWKNYLDWLSSDSGEMWLFDDVSEEDLDAFTQILNQGDPYSYSLATTLSSNRLFVSSILGTLGLSKSSWNNDKGRLHYQSLLNTTASILVSDCEVPGLNYPITSISKVINAYIISFEEIVCTEESDLQDCMDKLILCQPNIEQLHLAAKGDNEAMEASSYFHNNLVELKCLETKSVHSVCNFAWKYRVLGLAHMLASVRDKCQEYCKDSSHEVVGAECRENMNTSIVLGLEFYALMEDDKAINYLHLALKDSSNCKELHDTIVYIALHVIYSRHDDQQGMEDSLAGIAKADFQHTNMTCYTAIYGDTVIPFLNQVNETVLAKKLRDMRIDSYLQARAKCRDHLLNCQSENRYKTPIVKTLLGFSPLWVKSMLTANTSLFCSVSKEVMAGCESPFPFMTTILEMQLKMKWDMSRFIDELSGNKFLDGKDGEH